MVKNFNDTKTGSDYPEIKKFIGVGTIKILSINPNNSILRQYGWSVPEGAEEPSYVSTDSDGKKTARVRFLVQVQELDEKPIIAMDFWIRPEYRTSSSTGEQKAQVIDNYGRTAYVTQEEYNKRAIPLTSNGNPAKIDKKYRMAHSGEADLTQFLMAFLNVTPFERFVKATNSWVQNTDPGELTIDNWNRLCNGDVGEIKQMVNMKPNNQMKVCFGVRTTQDNKSYQAFLTSSFFANTMYLNPETNKYIKAENEIKKYLQWRGENSSVTLTFDASPIHEWTVSATDVKDNSEQDAPASIFPDAPVDFSSPEYFEENPDDLPFGK